MDEPRLHKAALPINLGFSRILHGSQHTDVGVVLAEGRVNGDFEPAARISLFRRYFRRNSEM